MLRQNLYALLETGSKPAMNEVPTYTQGVRHLQDFYDFLTNLVDLEEMPPPFSYIKGMPVPTYESIMQGIST